MLNFVAMESLFARHFGIAPEKVVPIAASGSNRRYFRISAGTFSAVAVQGTEAAENRAFIAFSEHFRKQGLPVPEIYGVSRDGLCYLQEDLGDVSLFSRLDDRQAVLRTVALLPKVQVLGARGLDFSLCWPLSAFDRRSVFFDLDYFKYCFLKPSGIDFDENRLQDEFELLADELLKSPADYFMYRDFQSRNIMLRDGQPYLIDYQGGRKGPLEYDLASFVWQAKAAFPEAFREELVETYLEALSALVPVDRELFRRRLGFFVLFRTLQVLGCYGFRGLVEKKAHFISSIPFALDNLSAILEGPSVEPFPYLAGLLSELVRKRPGSAKCAELPSETVPGVLYIDVMSFSYRKGIPDDLSGNGGGYVFDCRGMDNPGRYAEYRNLTGLDRPVIEFLEARAEVDKFLSHALPLVDAHAECFLERGLSHLSVFFGCTGGQHRSVYCAEHAAAHLKEKFGDRIRVRLVHRERGMERIL